MTTAPLGYQACFFADINDIKPSADTIPPLLDLFRKEEFLPSTYPELGVAPLPQLRLRLASQQGGWVIDFDSRRISVERNRVTPEVVLGTPQEFVTTATDFFDRILKLYPRKGNRLSLVTRELVPEMSTEGLLKVYERVALPLDFYKEHHPDKWKLRSIARVPQTLDDREEICNVITDVERVESISAREGVLDSCDRIKIGFDINTFQGNTTPRFEVSSLAPFFEKALHLRENIIEMLEKVING